MRVTYYALKPIQVGDEVRQAGDLVPEALAWPYISGYVQDGKLAPVLVATLPEAQQRLLLDWEAAVLGVPDQPVEDHAEPTAPVKVTPKKKGA